MMRVGLIGATGRVGVATLRRLVGDSDIAVRCAGRSQERVAATISSVGNDRCEAVELDLFVDVQLDRFCRSVDLVINCAGPSGVVLDRVIAAAARAERSVIDAGGYDPVLERLPALAGSRRSEHGAIIVGVGLMPGLSGLYPRWIAEAADETPERLDVFYAGTDSWGPSSAWDIVQSLGDFGAERPPSYVSNGELRTVPFRKAFRTMRLPDPVGRVRGFLVYTEELGRLSADLGIGEIRCHGVNNGRWSGMALGFIKMMKLHRSPRWIARSAGWLHWAAMRDQRAGQAPCFAIHSAASWKDGRRREATLVIGDTYEATGAVVACVARMVLMSEIRVAPGRSRIGMMHELLDAERFLRLFRSCGCILTEEAPQW